MENVSNILSETHKHNFKEWQEYLTSVGYYNHVYKLSAKKFGMPQSRERVFMISVQCSKNEKVILEQYFNDHNLEDYEYIKKIIQEKKLSDCLRMNYLVEKYKVEADLSQPNFTPSRQKIYKESKIIADGTNVFTDFVTTITTKQDRNPNSGLISYKPQDSFKAPYRNLTGRECILLMGFKEEQFDKLEKHNFYVNKSRKMFTNAKYIKMAGNSIVVQVLEQIFRQISEIDNLLDKKIRYGFKGVS